jgi:hypothetical protein
VTGGTILPFLIHVKWLNEEGQKYCIIFINK